MTRTAETPTVIDPDAAQALVTADPDVVLVDVRGAAEYATAHVPGSVNLPLDQIDAHLPRLGAGAGGRLVLVCQSGARSRQAGERLRAAGLADVAVLDGGLNAWTAAGGSVERTGPTRWALERQIRLVAGGIVALSVLGSIRVPAVRFVAGGVGAGLVVAALTDSCLMGRMLAKLPYNRGPQVDIEQSIARITGAR